VNEVYIVSCSVVIDK